MKRPFTTALVALLVAGIAGEALALNPQPLPPRHAPIFLDHRASAVAIGVRPQGAGGSGAVAETCSGPHVTVFVYKHGVRERMCKCAPGAVGQLIENASTHAKELRCLMPAGPRPR